MIDSQKGHLFFWRSRNNHFWRVILAISISSAVAYVVLPRIPLPFTSEARARRDLSIQRDLNSQSLKPVLVVEASRINSSDLNSQFFYNDPLSLSDEVSAHVHSQLDLAFREVLQSYQENAPERQLSYAEVPAPLPPGAQSSITIRPDTPMRFVESYLSQTTAEPLPATSAFTLRPSFAPASPDFAPSLPDIELPSADLSFHLSTSKDGFVSYAISLQPDYHSDQLQSWIYSLKFPPSTQEKSYQLTLSVAPVNQRRAR